MSGVVPMGSVTDYQSRREEELERIEPARKPLMDEKQEPLFKADSMKQAEKTTIQNYQYTGKGSFIDKVF